MPRDAIYLLAPVKVVATWTLANIRRFRLEQTVHKVFGPAQLQLSRPDRFGFAFEPREWFVVPLPVIDEAMKRIKDGTITDFVYDVNRGMLQRSDA